MHELTAESEERILEYLATHPDPAIWDTLIGWLRPLCEDPRGHAGFAFPADTYFTFVPGTEIAVVYSVADEPRRVVEILRID